MNGLMGLNQNPFMMNLQQAQQPNVDIQGLQGMKEVRLQKGQEKQGASPQEAQKKADPWSALAAVVIGSELSGEPGAAKKILDSGVIEGSMAPKILEKGMDSGLAGEMFDKNMPLVLSLLKGKL